MDISFWCQLALEQKHAELAKSLDKFEDKIHENSVKLWHAIKDYDHKQNTLLALYVLSPLQVNEILFPVIDKLLKDFDAEQAKHNMKKINQVARGYKDFLIKNKISIKGLKTIEVAIRQTDAKGLGLTELHVHYLQLALDCHMHKAAAKLIDKHLIHLDKDASIDEPIVYMYLYYSGVVYLGLKQFDKAKRCLSFCLQLQQRDVHAICLEARKKLILLILRESKDVQRKLNVLDGGGRNMMETKVMDELCSAYLKLGDEKVIKKEETYNKILAENQQEYQKDDNLGLVLQVRQAPINYEIKSLQKAFLNFKIADLAKHILNTTGYKINSIEELQQMLHKVKPCFQIDQKTQSIQFVSKDQLDYEKLCLNPLKDKFELLKTIKLEYEIEHEDEIKRRLQQPDTIFA